MSNESEEKTGPWESIEDVPLGAWFRLKTDRNAAFRVTSVHFEPLRLGFPISSSVDVDQLLDHFEWNLDIDDDFWLPCDMSHSLREIILEAEETTDLKVTLDEVGVPRAEFVDESGCQCAIQDDRNGLLLFGIELDQSCRRLS